MTTQHQVLGRAVTRGQALPLGVDDPIVAARAVRRALADAGRRAADCEAMAVASPDTLAPGVLARFARRALGPHGDRMPVRGVPVLEPDADILAARAAAELAASGPLHEGVGIAVGLGADGTAVALCLGNPP
ncbi:hypothetical protein BH24CHL9_BH24CHL9_04600 [soil metagenome]